MIITTKKIFTGEISEAQTPELFKFLQFDNFTVSTSDNIQKAVFTYRETAFNWEDISPDENSQEVIDEETGEPVIPDENSEANVLRRKVNKVVKFRRKEFDYDTFFTIRNQIRQSLPEGLTDAQEWATINEHGLVAMILQEGYYQGQFEQADFEFIKE